MFLQCGALCPQVCNGPGVCNGGCAEGCFCPDGQVVNDQGQCMVQDTCGSNSGKAYIHGTIIICPHIYHSYSKIFIHNVVSCKRIVGQY